MSVSNQPRFSVIIPARNEQDYVAAIIASVQAQDFEQPPEIIVVNSVSVDRTVIVARQAGATVVDAPKGGLPQARETGRLAAGGEILVYVDADMRLPKNYLSAIDRAFKDNRGAVAVTNPFTFYDGTEPQQALITFYSKVVYPLQNVLLHAVGKSSQVLGGNFAVTAEALEGIGGFDTEGQFQGEDLAISKRLAPLGNIVVLPKLYTQTSARRFATRGSLATAAFYVRNFFGVLLFPKNQKISPIKLAVKLAILAALLLTILWLVGISQLIVRHPLGSAVGLALGTVGLFIYAMNFPKSGLFGEVLSTFNTSEKIVALTFDDGPRAGSTEQVLDILRAEDVAATFFVIGQHVHSQPEIVRRIAAERHDIGNHTFSHQWRLPFLTTKGIDQQVASAQKEIDDVLGQTPTVKLFRPPHGWRTPWLLKTLHRQNYQVITWDISLDFLPGVSAEAIRERYLRKVKPGSILLFHDAIWERMHDNRDNMLDALPKIIHELKRRGYRVVRISEML